MQEPKQGAVRDLANVARGFLMGGADIIPGVSGGTVALILGIYQRLVTAISHFDLALLRHVRHGEFGAAARHIDLRFLLTLGLGIGVGIVSLASLMNDLITNQLIEGFQTRPLTLAAFFGLILASGFLVGKMVQRWSLPVLLLLLGGAAIAFLITGLKGKLVEPTYLYIFFCGTIAICAMILPGISGAFILVLLGMYVYVTDAIKEAKLLLRGEFPGEELLVLAIFACGCAVGLISFSKVLRLLLARFESATMALLCGFMLGSLRKIWPFQKDITPNAPLKLKQFENELPDAFDAQVLLALGIALAAAGFVLTLDRFARGSEHVPPLEDETTT